MWSFEKISPEELTRPKLKMGLSSVVGALILFTSICQLTTVAGMRQIPSLEKFQLHISERGAKFVEQIEVNEGKGAAYFQVPPHNGLSETDDMFDFKINITVSRVKKDRACYISPLPPDLPRPNVLSKGLKKVSKLPPNHNISTTRQQWIVAGTVDKRTLRKEVEDFCGQFSIYRLEPYVPYSVSVVASDEGQSHADRIRRQSGTPGTKFFILCNNNIPQCDPNSWVYQCRIATSRCVYYVPCILDQVNTIVSCSTLTQHRYSSLVCCVPTCPTNG